jgi:hypothetical protein
LISPDGGGFGGGAWKKEENMAEGPYLIGIDGGTAA